MRRMAAEDEVMYRGWMTFRISSFEPDKVRTAYFGSYSKETTAKQVVSNEIRLRSYNKNFVLIAHGVHEARVEWKPVEGSDDSG